MATFEKSIQIAAVPEVVWECLIQPNLITKWWTAVRDYHFTSEQKIGLGMTFAVEEKIGKIGPRIHVRFEVIKWLKPERIAFKMISGTGAEHYEISWMLEPLEGGTLFNYVEHLTLSSGYMDKVWGLWGRRSGMGHIEGYLRNLKALAESQAVAIAKRKVV